VRASTELRGFAGVSLRSIEFAAQQCQHSLDEPRVPTELRLAQAIGEFDEAFDLSRGASDISR
jgi:hypothetical protein